jgi:hypothetical protein
VICTLTAEIKSLFQWREAVGEVNAVDFEGMLAEPAVEWIRGGTQPGERRLQIIGLDVDDGEIAGGSRLDPDGFSGDSAALARDPVGRLGGVLAGLSDIMPLSYAVDAIKLVTSSTRVSAELVRDMGIVFGCILIALLAGAATLPRRTP